MIRLYRTVGLAAAASALVLAAGCHVDMWVQNKVKPYRQSDFFADGSSARPLVAGVVPRAGLSDVPGRLAAEESTAPDALRVGNVFYTAVDPTTHKLIDALPNVPPFDREPLLETLKRGRERFDIFCSPCHGRLGNGKGMIAQRGLALRKQPRDYHEQRMLRMPLGHFYLVISNGFGVMYSYASRVPPADRWRIAAYIRVLQYSQTAPVADVPGNQRASLDNPATNPPSEPPAPAAAVGAPGASAGTYSVPESQLGAAEGTAGATNGGSTPGQTGGGLQGGR